MDIPHFIHVLADTHFTGLQVEITVNKSAISIHMSIFLQACIFGGKIPRGGSSGSYKCMFNLGEKKLLSNVAI